MNISTRRLLFWSLVLLSLCTTWNLSGQACGCLDCPAPIPTTFSNFQLRYQVDGALNDALASNNCIESVQLTFKHNRVQNLAIDLISPAGQVVTLVGMYVPFGGSLSGTLGAQWDVHFVPCAGVPAPDLGLSPFWDNLSPGWNVFFGDFSGRYFPPFGNCLENFNMGSVNGTWRINVTSHDFPPVTGEGIIENFSINFCDETGINCCFPDGGTLANADPINICETEAIPPLDLTTNFNAPFDSSSYFYTYLLSKDGIITAIDTNLTFINAGAGEYIIQGLAYAQVDSAAVSNLVGTSAEELSDTLLTSVPPFCGELSTNVQRITIFPEAEIVIQEELLCAGESINVAGQIFDATGIYDITLPATVGCDTLLRLQLEILMPDTTRLTESICAGERIQLGDQIFGSTGQYSLLLQNTNGCDSLVVLDLVVQDVQADIQNNAALNCLNPVLRLNGENSSTGSAIAYTWTSRDGNILEGSNTLMPLVNASGTYILLVEDIETGCMAQDSIFVPEDRAVPPLDLPASVMLNCNQNSYSVELGTFNNAINYVWFDVDGIAVSNDFEPNLFIGSYTVNATNMENGCTNTASIQIEQLAPPTIRIRSEDIAQECLELRQQLEAESDASSPLQYTWLDGNGTTIARTPMLEIQAAGRYYLEAFDAQTRCTTMDSILVEMNDTRLIEGANLRVQQLDCLDHPVGSIEVQNVQGGQSPFVYALNSDIFSSNPSFIALEPNTYTLRIQDAQGCEWDTSLVINKLSALEIDLGDIRRIGLGERVELEALSNRPLSSYAWSSAAKDSLSCPTCPTQTIMPLQNTTFSLQAIDENGCTASSEVQIVVLREVPIYIPNAFSPNGDGNNDTFEIYPRVSAVEAIEELRIFNRWGALVFEQSSTQEAWDGRYKGKLLPPDVYIVSANVRYIDGRTEVLKGEVTLMR